MQTNGAQIGGTIVKNIPYTSWDRLPAHIEKDTSVGQVTYQNHEDTVQAVFHSQTPLGNIGGVMIRRDIIGDTRFRTDLFIGEDFWFIYENLIKGASSVFLKQRWYYCRIHKKNTSNNFGFEGFWTRFLRRKLVWESELALGRPQNANVHKSGAISVYYKCLGLGKLNREENVQNYASA